ncbi:MAG: phosphotransferase family protein [Hyphomonadaceae bacterium]|nr:phosphotransferase family protein [Hyphomonadaceae bacterium]
MDKIESRHINAFRRYLDGPVGQALSADKTIGHVPKQMAASLTRLLARSNSANAQYADMRASARVLLDAKGAFTSSAGHNLCKRLHDQLDAMPEDNNALDALLIEALTLLRTEKGVGAETAYKNLVQQDIARTTALEQAYDELLRAPGIAAASQPGDTLTTEQIGRLLGELKARCDEPDDLQVVATNIVVGGYSKLTVFVSLRNNRVLPSEIVVRFDRPESPQDTTVASEYPLLRALYARGVKVPRPLYIDNEGIILGAPLIIVAREPGQIVADPHKFHEPGPNHKLAISMAQDLAALHTVPLEALPASLPGRAQSNHALAIEDLKSLREVWTATASKSTIVEAAFHWLEANIEHVGEHKSLVHGDFRFNNILVEDSSVACILDWELASVRNPAFDLGYAYHHVVQLAPWNVFIAAYEAAGAPCPPDVTINFFALRTELFAVVYLTKLEAGFAAGAFNNIDLIYAGTHVRQHNLYLLAKRLAAVTHGETM